MGCDIHMVVEVRDYYDLPDGNESDEKRWFLVMTEAAAYGDRNYNVFSALADVRNHAYGDRRITPIAQPRGFPGDASEEAKKAHGRWGRDAHSASWLSLMEVLEYDWAKVEDCQHFFDWAKSLNMGPTRLGYRALDDIRIVFWFDN